jgi:hypothetical protein
MATVSLKKPDSYKFEGPKCPLAQALHSTVGENGTWEISACPSPPLEGPFGQRHSFSW